MTHKHAAIGVNVSFFRCRPECESISSLCLFATGHSLAASGHGCSYGGETKNFPGVQNLFVELLSMVSAAARDKRACKRMGGTRGVREERLRAIELIALFDA
jgi:hypothetical protein